MTQAATNGQPAFRTNFVHGATLSPSELEAVIKLANLCGIDSATDVSTELHLSGRTILVAGDETREGRLVTFKSLLIYGKDARRTRFADAVSVGEFWAESAEPTQEKRTIVKVGDREVRVGLLNGIKPSGADKIFDALAKGGQGSVSR